MSAPSDASLAGLADEVRRLADGLAVGLSAAARSRTSVACQRALLRAVGVDGLAPDGRPLARQVVSRYVDSDRGLLQSGVALPFALAAYEYDLDPQQLALEIVAGHVDLASEAQLLPDRARSAPAAELLDAWLAAADDRFEANRVARAELLALFGDPPVPWLAVEEPAFDARDAALDASALVAAGADMVRVRVPRDGELRDDIGALSDEDDWPTGPDAPPPAGSQRGLARVRAALDEAAARNDRYPRLAARRVGLAAPELAIVAGFERVDVVFVDPFDAMSELHVDADRALADHAFAHALLARAGTRLVLGPGPLVQQPASEASAPASSGRALALQALSHAFTLHNGFPPERLEISAIPAISFERGWKARGLVEVALRSLLFPGHRLVIDAHVADANPESVAPALVTWLASGADVGAVFDTAQSTRSRQARGALRAAVDASLALGRGRSIGPLRGAALEHAAGALRAAVETLQEIGEAGIAALVPPGERLGAEGLAEIDGELDRATAWVLGPPRAPGPDGRMPVIG